MTYPIRMITIAVTILAFLSLSMPKPVASQATGYAFHWNGAVKVYWYVLNASDKKEVATDSCDPGETTKRDLPPGDYILKSFYNNFASFKVTINRGEMINLNPPVGTYSFHWNGANKVYWYVLDARDGKTQVGTDSCDPNETSKNDLPPGDYILKSFYNNFAAFKVTISNGQVTNITKP